ncbi:MAG: hypothetical protein KGH63_01240 [Candidatus Micrarchaeota archaeon]|nr:hypothetical protein [Candidatus Micrarchaeota archaeon]
MPTEPLTFQFSSPSVAKKAAGLLTHQLQSVGDTKVKASVRGSEVSLSITTPTPVGKKAAEYTAKRLAKILIYLDAPKSHRSLLLA